MTMPPGQSAVAAEANWPQDILDRIGRLLEYHRTSKLTYDDYHAQPLGGSPHATAWHPFEDSPKVLLPTNLISADAATVSLLAEGRDAVPQSQLDPPPTLKTLATWLFLAAGVIKKIDHGWLRTVPSNGDSYPCEIYVAAFGIDDLPQGFYYFNSREFVLRKLRKGTEVLAELNCSARTSAAVLVSTVFFHATAVFQKRGYRTALLDAGHVAENLTQAGTALGMPIATRLRPNDAAMRSLIGLPPAVPFAFAEAVQAVVEWDGSGTNAPAPAADDSNLHLPLLNRTAAEDVVPFDSVMLAHDDCAAGGEAQRDIVGPLTELSPLTPNVPAYERPVSEETWGGKALGHLLMQRKPAGAFARQPISRDQLLTINLLAMRGSNYEPLKPPAKHAALVRPLWIVHAVAGMDSGVWYYHPPTDRWSMLARGDSRLEAEYLSREQKIAGDAAAVCVLVAHLEQAMFQAGPDAYRLANLEAGIVAHRMQLLAEAQELGACCTANFYDEEWRKFFGLIGSGWEILYEFMVGVPFDDEHPEMPELVDDAEGQNWRG